LIEHLPEKKKIASLHFHLNSWAWECLAIRERLLGPPIPRHQVHLLHHIPMPGDVLFLALKRDLRLHLKGQGMWHFLGTISRSIRVLRLVCITHLPWLLLYLHRFQRDPPFPDPLRLQTLIVPCVHDQTSRSLSTLVVWQRVWTVVRSRHLQVKTFTII